ncbi:E3 ubiquitin-protein ligase RHA1B-like [Dendrobium catenatum]|uniref:E3 ubiquitin-protein ligase RHA1B n=1 Tax=Dendrobium catenatum TaxID=906689 RepID=A0A2I0WEY7_9ASPA|nr:E3 ubiquitin-protein ligase RHA1B-like [Dendrobium catenatum]PKU74217.1 E3 ubiquitin-protein ligase RHA1B [Dendrobium catenatum]
MGFPVGYSDLLFPKLIFHLIFFLNFLRRLISSIFAVAGLSHLLESEVPWPDANLPPELCSASAILIQEILPVVRFDELLKGEGEGRRRPLADGCAVCLYEFEEREEVRWLSNCRHVFHRGCLDRWVNHDQRTCPLCRTLLIPEEMQEAFERRLWASSGVDGSFAGGEFDDSTSSVSPS